MNAEFFAAVADIEKEKGIPKEYMYEKITQALLAAFRKDNVEYEGNVEVLLDETAKKIQLVEYKVVVEDVYEPYLLQLGFIARTPRGRICLKDGYKHMGLKPSLKAQRQMSLFEDE